jgi:hypothetical protein
MAAHGAHLPFAEDSDASCRYGTLLSTLLKGKHMKIISLAQVCAELLARDPLRDFFSFWDEVNQVDIDALREALESAKREEDIQQFLQANPKYLI